MWKLYFRVSVRSQAFGSINAGKTDTITAGKTGTELKKDTTGRMLTER